MGLSQDSPNGLFMKYTHILWDFNGTILDDVETGIRSVNTLLSQRGLPCLSCVDDYHKVFGFPIIEYYRRLGFDLDREKYKVIAPLWVAEYLKNVKDAKVFDDVLYAVETFRGEGVKQIILSATERDMLLSQLSDIGLGGAFDDVLGLDNIHAASKVGIAQGWKDEHPDAVALIIGDTVHDAEVARAISADCILISRGHQSRDVLLGTGFPVFDNLKKAIEKITR